MIVKCIFCQKDFGNVPALREHSATCEDHPAVEESGRLRKLVKTAYMEGWSDSLRLNLTREEAWGVSESKPLANK